MKKVVLSFVLGCGLVLSFASCEKCKDCEYTYLGTTVDAGELCGDALDAAEDEGYDCN